jgi:hypothetical protein
MTNPYLAARFTASSLPGPSNIVWVDDLKRGCLGGSQEIWIFMQNRKGEENVQNGHGFSGEIARGGLER